MTGVTKGGRHIQLHLSTSGNSDRTKIHGASLAASMSLVRKLAMNVHMKN
jgi:hypothetical protein